MRIHSVGKEMAIWSGFSCSQSWTLRCVSIMRSKPISGGIATEHSSVVVVFIGGSEIPSLSVTTLSNVILLPAEYMVSSSSVCVCLTYVLTTDTIRLSDRRKSIKLKCQPGDVVLSFSNHFDQEQHFCDYLFNFFFLFLTFPRPLVSHMAEKVGKENDIAFPDFGALSVGGCGGVFLLDCASAMRDAMEQKRQELFPDWPVVE